MAAKLPGTGVSAALKRGSSEVDASYGFLRADAQTPRDGGYAPNQHGQLLGLGATRVRRTAVPAGGHILARQGAAAMLDVRYT